MNVYDWDKTIYDGDSSIDFYKFNLKNNPKIAKYWPKQLKASMLYKAGKITKTEMKTIFYEYFKAVDNIDDAVLKFWQAHRHKIKPWYYDQQRSDDLIISASPDFLLRPMMESLNVALIASSVNKLTGEHLAENCYGSEKVRRMKLLYNIEEMESFYSDSYSDDPLAQYAKQSFLVVKDELRPW